MENSLVSIWDNQQSKMLLCHYRLANHLINSYPSRFVLNPYSITDKERNDDMARLAQKVNMPYQHKWTLDDLKDKEIVIDSLEKRNAETSHPFYVVRFTVGKDTGYFSTGLASLVEYFDRVKKTDLPAEAKFVLSGTRWVVE